MLSAWHCLPRNGIALALLFPMVAVDPLSSRVPVPGAVIVSPRHGVLASICPIDTEGVPFKGVGESVEYYHALNTVLNCAVEPHPVRGGK